MKTVERLRQVLGEAGVRTGETRSNSLVWSWSAGSIRGQSEAARGTVVVDAVGVGGGVADRLQERGYRVEEFTGGGAASDSTRFLITRAEAYWTLRKKLEAGGIGLPGDEMLMDDLLSVRWRTTHDDRIRLEAKDEVRSRLGRSPDRADAVAMAFSATGQTGKLVWSG